MDFTSLELGALHYLLIAIILLLLYIYSIQPKSSFPPTPLRLPLVGTAWGHKGQPRYQFYHSRPERFGRVIGGFFGPYATVSISDPDILQEVLVKNATQTNGRMATFGDESFSAQRFVSSLNRPTESRFQCRGIYDNFDKVSEGYGLVACDGQRWKINRRLAWTSLFTNEKIRGCFASTIEGECSSLVDYLDQCCARGTILDLTNVFPRFTLRVISKLIFGRPLGFYEACDDDWNEDKEEEEVLEWVEFIFEYMSNKHVLERMIKPLRRLPWAKWHKFLATVKKLRQKLTDLVEEAEIQLASGRAKKLNFVTLLVESKQSNAEFSTVDRDDVVTMLVDFILAGTDTTSNLCSFVVAELINHPEHQQRLIDETDQIFGNSQPSVDKIDQLNWTDAIVNETLRLHTIAPIALPHRVTDDLHLREWVVSKNTMIFPNIWSIHHQETYWDKAYEFFPERWLENSKSIKQSGNFIPFSTGPRKCPGRHLANAEVKLVLAHIFQRFTFVGRDGDPNVKIKITELAGLTVKPESFWVIPRRRL